MGVSRRAVRRYYLYRATVAVGLATPVWVVYLIARTDPATAGLLQAVWWLALVVFEVPTGYVADRLGWRQALLVGTAGLGLALIGAAVATDALGLGVAFAVGGLLGTFRSGTADAWLYEVLDTDGEDATFSRVRGRGNTVMLLVTGATAVAGGALAERTSMAATFAVDGMVVLLGTVVVLGLPAAEGVETEGRLTPAAAGALLRAVAGRAPLRRVVLASAVLLGGLYGLNLVSQPVLRDLGVSLSGLGWYFALFTGAGALLNYRAGWIEEHVGARTWALGGSLALGVALVAVALAPVLAVPLFVLARGANSLTTTLVGGYVNDRIEGLGRATVLSAVGMVFQVAGATAQTATGWAAGRYGYVPTLGRLGVVVLAATGLLLLLVVGRRRATGTSDPAGGD